MFLDDEGHLVIICGAEYKKAIEAAIKDYKEAGQVEYKEFEENKLLGNISSIRYGGHTYHFVPAPDCMNTTFVPVIDPKFIQFKPPTEDSYDGKKLPIFLADEVGQCAPPRYQSPSPEMIKRVAKHQELISKHWLRFESIFKFNRYKS